jgi:DNA topoisomerase-3
MVLASPITLIVAEKPSMARDIARVVGAQAKREGYLEGNGVWVSWCIGHLAELCEPHEYDPRWKSWSPEFLPILPEQLRVRPSRSGAAHLRLLHRLMRAREVATIVNACDAGREGELIFRYVHELSGCDKPVRRLWISSLTAEAIRHGMAQLRPGADMDPLADAARSRADADWLVGINATRALTGLARQAASRAPLMSVGRVQTPTLALIVRREQEIEAFTSEPYWQVQATFALQRGAGTYQGLWHRPGSRADGATGRADGATSRADAGGEPGGEPGERDDKGRDDTATRLATRAEAEEIAAAVSGRAGAVAQVERKTVREKPPLLFDLTNLQKTANQRFRMSAKRTLELAQALYETHKAITYPRTDSRHLTPDMAAELPALLQALARPYGELAAQALARGVPAGTRMIDASQVGDHHAIIPTAAVPDLERLTPDERKIYELVARRFLAGFFPDAVFENTRIETGVEGHRFVSTGRVCVEPGWHAAEPPPQSRTRERLLPLVQRDAPVDTTAVEIREGKTQPPRRYTEATLLGAMEHAGRGLDDPALRRAMRDVGLGTPATRAAIIETLLERKYIERKASELHPTPHGRALIAAIPVEDLLSAELTGAWEQKLAAIAAGRASRARFMDEIRAFTTRIVAACATATPPALEAPADEVLGMCPVCKTPVTEGFKTFQCASGKRCSFVIWKRIAGRAVSPALVRVLLGRGRSQVLKGFRSKKGKRFSAALALGPDGKVQFAFDEGAPAGRLEASEHDAGEHDLDEHGPSEREHGSRATSARRTSPRGQSAVRKKRATRKQPARTAAGATAGAAPTAPPPCPACGHGHIISGNRAWGCSRWRESCKFVVAFEHAGVRVPDHEADRLFRRGQTRLMDGLSPQGRARLVLDLTAPGNVRIESSKRTRSTRAKPP